MVRRRLDAPAASHGALPPCGGAEEERVASVPVLALQVQNLARVGQVLDLGTGDEEAPRRRARIGLRGRLKAHAVVLARARSGRLGDRAVGRSAALRRTDRLATNLRYAV